MPHQNPSDSSADPSSKSRRERRLDLRVLDAETGDGIPAVQVELHQDGRRVAAARSDEEGRAAFAPLKPGAYQVIQASYPKQMTGISAKPVVQVGKDGSLHLGSEPIREIRMLNFHLRH